MKKMLLPGLMLVFASVLHAQFYAPETAFHDRAQRVFPVEAARVLAWRANATGAAVAEVSYRFESTAEETIWHLQWLDAQKKPVRDMTVRYPASLAVGGPKYFREVFAQLAEKDAVAKPQAAGEVDTAFWDGARLARVSRLQAVAAAGQQIERAPAMARATDAARLAGTLAHGVMPLLGSPLTIDSMLLSRAAAWLCLAEQMSGTPDDAAWAPILFLSGREHFAQAAWLAAPAPAGAERGDAGRFWNFILRTPSAKDCFLFAARPDNRQYAMPAMMYPMQFDPAWADLLVEVADGILGREMIAQLFEYGPNVSMRGHVGGGHWGARMTGLSMGAWLGTMAAFHPLPGDFLGYQSVLKEVGKSATPAGTDEGASIAALAPLLNLGLHEGSGVLIPVATATARDLLGYGWEMAGLQLGYTYNFLAGKLGDPAAAKEIEKPALENIKGIETFFRKPNIVPRYPLGDLLRLQYVGSSLVEDTLLERMPEGWQSPPERFLSRTWLSRGGIGGIEAAIRNQATPEDLRAYIARLRQEGGPLAVCNLVHSDRPGTQYPRIIDSLGLREELLAEMPWSFNARLRGVQEQFKNSSFERAKAWEKIGWENLTFSHHYRIFFDYLAGNAIESAKRFYDEAVPYIIDTVGFSNSTGPARYALAWFEGDEEMERRAIEDSSTFSYSDLRMQATNAVLHGQYAEAVSILDAAHERYENEEMLHLKSYLPMVPALLDTKHPDHARAIEGFPDDKTWLFLRWALAHQAHLPVDEIVRLFHDKTEGAEGMFVAAAKGDKERLRALYTKMRLNPMEEIVIMREFQQLNGSKPQADQPDLMPPGARPLQDQIREVFGRPRG